MELSHAHRLNRIFAYYHNRREPELSEQAFATIIGHKLVREGVYDEHDVLDPQLLVDVREGRRELPLDIADAVCEQIGLTTHDYFRGTATEVYERDQQLRLWTIARDLGLDHLAARAIMPNQIEALIEELQADFGQVGGTVTPIR